jgi:hypothetical protein
MDQELQEYLKGYFSKTVEKNETDPGEFMEPVPGNPVTAPEEFHGADWGMMPKEKKVEEVSDKDDDLPF